MIIAKILLGMINFFYISLVTILAIYIIFSNFNVFGDYRTFLVQSGSMEPAIMTGDIIITKRQNTYEKNNVITFYGSTERIVTHRIVDINNDEGYVFHTKGDANRTDDEDLIPSSNVLGRVVLVVPKIGYLVGFCKTLQGFLILVLIPFVLYVTDELIKIKND